MGVEVHHPLYDAMLPDWELLRDAYLGERAVKALGRAYLPATAGMVMDGMEKTTDKGWLAYSAYVKRAVFPEFVKEAVESMIGVMHSKPAVFELPPALEPLLEQATLRKESLQMLLRRINEQQICRGRIGMLADAPNGVGTALPYIAIYPAEAIINWDEGTRDGTVVDNLNLVVLDETETERQPDGFEWKLVRKYRVLVLGDPKANEKIDQGAVYRVGVFREDKGGFTFSEDALIEPAIQGTKLDRIPFVFVNSKDIVPTPDTPPLLGLANLAMTVYRGEADYRQALFMQGQDTLVVIGGDKEEVYRTGAGASITPPIQGDAKFIGVASEGLAEMRSAIENDHARAGRKTNELVNETSNDRESGDALRIRVAARTATLNQIAITGAFALQEMLRMIATWVGADPEKVKVTPNLDFVDEQLPPADLVDLMTAKGLGAPIALESIHKYMQKRGMTDLAFEEEVELIEGDKDLGILPVPATDEDGPADDAPPGQQPPGGKAPAKKPAAKPPAK